MGRRSRTGLAKDGVMIGSMQFGTKIRVLAVTGTVSCLFASSAFAQVGPLVPESAAVQPVSQVVPRPAAQTQPNPSAETVPAVTSAGQAWSLPETERLPLGAATPPSEIVAAAGEEPETGPTLPAGTLRTTLALGGVLLLIASLAWVFKRVARMSGGLAGAVGAGGRAPAGLVEVLARYPLGAKQTLVVLRFDRRVLLCSMSGGGRSGGGAMTTLCELDHAEDVASVLIKARDDAGESIAKSFERAMDDADRDADRSGASEPIKVRVPAGYAQSQQAYAQQSSNPLARGLGALARGRYS
jgi:flagellar biogenesis protein FliO